MEIFLAGAGLWHHVLPRFFEAGKDSSETKDAPSVKLSDANILMSFYYVNKWQERSIRYVNSFMLDSGAFTFFSQGKNLNWDEYVERYADYVKQKDIKLFFELDIDSLVGYDKVLQIREKLEKLAGRRCIPGGPPADGRSRPFLRPQRILSTPLGIISIRIPWLTAS